MLYWAKDNCFGTPQTVNCNHARIPAEVLVVPHRQEVIIQPGIKSELLVAAESMIDLVYQV